MRLVAAIGVALLVIAITASEFVLRNDMPSVWGGWVAGLLAGAAAFDLMLADFPYLLPLRIARSRNHPDAGYIGAVNALFGWTMIGWAAALVWAVARRPRAAEAIAASAAASRPAR